MGLGAVLASGLHRRSHATLEVHAMDSDRFDTLIRALTTTRSRRGAVRLLAGSALGSLLTVGTLSTEARKGGKKGKKGKVTICHNGQTIRVSKSALKGHKKHGDTDGPCPPPFTCGGHEDDGKPCGSGQQCSGGVCGTPPNCLRREAACTVGGQPSCCSRIGCDAGSQTCSAGGQAGDPCVFNNDCFSVNCVGFICQPGARGKNCLVDADCLSNDCSPVAGGTCE